MGLAGDFLPLALEGAEGQLLDRPERSLHAEDGDRRGDIGVVQQRQQPERIRGTRVGRG